MSLPKFWEGVGSLLTITQTRLTQATTMAAQAVYSHLDCPSGFD